MNNPIVWSVGGSDADAGRDSEMFEAFEVRGHQAFATHAAAHSFTSGQAQPVPQASLQTRLDALGLDAPPQVIKTGVLGSVENLKLVLHCIDRLRQQRRTAVVMGPLLHAHSAFQAGEHEAMRVALIAELLPRATLVTLGVAEAAWLLQQGAAVGRDNPQSLAADLRALGAQGVVIVGTENPPFAWDWLDTPQASGWLSLPNTGRQRPEDSAYRFAASAAAALALGFCHADAAVLAKMSISRDSPTDAASRSHIGFGLNAAALPFLQTELASAATSFAALSNAWLGLYPVVDSSASVERVLKAGVRTVQLRIKEASTANLGQEIQRSVRAASAVNAQLFINDHWQLALEHGAYGVHLGQQDIQTADLNALRSAGLRLGLSSHCFWEVCRAHALGPSYIACGPIHATTTKDMPWWPQGAGNLAYWCTVLQTPVVAIAGMDVNRSIEAVRCGAAGVAVLRGITQVADPEAAIAQLTAAVNQGRRAERLMPPALPRSTLSGPVPPGWRA
ncbi:MAG TPA: thiamine phosphate synthase [Rhizobacter sp.]|nr:thiamine phosphate synthase [Rhizobacter sp.]